MTTKGPEARGGVQEVPRLALRAKEAAPALGIGENLLWQLTNRGEIPYIRVNKCILYPV